MVALEAEVSAKDSATSTGTALRVQITDSIGTLEGDWRALETDGGLFTPYQRYDFQKAWVDHVCPHDGGTPCILVAKDQLGAPQLILPLVVERLAGLRVASFTGGTHISYNMPLMSRAFAGSATRETVRTILRALRQQQPAIDVLQFERQPVSWEGVANPFATLKQQPSVNLCPVMTLEHGKSGAQHLSSTFRRRLNTKERKLEVLPGYSNYAPSADADINALLDAFFTIKRQRMAEQKLPDVFGEPGVAEFIRTACLARLPNGDPVIQLHALTCDEEVIAVFACVSNSGRASLMFNTYTVSANAKHSPGLILIRDLIGRYADQGCKWLDLGIGSDSYKRFFCKSDEPLFDSFVPMSASGWIGAQMLGTIARAKRHVKSSPKLAEFAQSVRHRLNQRKDNTT